MVAHQEFANFFGVVDEIGPSPVRFGGGNDIAVGRLQILQGRQRLRIHTQRERFFRSRGPPSFGFRQVHENWVIYRLGNALALARQAQYYIDPPATDTANSFAIKLS
jgi:hypothetical protein